MFCTFTYLYVALSHNNYEPISLCPRLFYFTYLSGCTHFQEHSNWSCMSKVWIEYFREICSISKVYIFYILITMTNQQRPESSKPSIWVFFRMSDISIVYWYENGCVWVYIINMCVYILLYNKSNVIIGYWLDSCSIVASHCIFHITRIW